jgi:hypothetical protein
VLEVEDLEDHSIDLDVVSVFELVGGKRGGSVLVKPNIDVVAVRVLRARTSAAARWFNAAPTEHHRRNVRMPTLALLGRAG